MPVAGAFRRGISGGRHGSRFGLCRLCFYNRENGCRERTAETGLRDGSAAGAAPRLYRETVRRPYKKTAPGTTVWDDIAGPGARASARTPIGAGAVRNRICAVRKDRRIAERNFLRRDAGKTRNCAVFPCAEGLRQPVCAVRGLRRCFHCRLRKEDGGCSPGFSRKERYSDGG